MCFDVSSITSRTPEQKRNECERKAEIFASRRNSQLFMDHYTKIFQYKMILENSSWHLLPLSSNSFKWQDVLKLRKFLSGLSIFSSDNFAKIENSSTVKSRKFVRRIAYNMAGIPRWENFSCFHLFLAKIFHKISEWYLENCLGSIIDIIS